MEHPSPTGPAWPDNLPRIILGPAINGIQVLFRLDGVAYTSDGPQKIVSVFDYLGRLLRRYTLPPTCP